MLCLSCLGRAVRISEGLENDAYKCEVCGKGFSVDWRRGGPDKPIWPPSQEDLRMAREVQRQMRLREEHGPAT
jgi:hypothetical protein